jgi:AcrR family transcriptional regulator
MKHTSVSEFAFPSGPLARRIRQRKQPVQARAQVTVEAVLEATLQVLVAEGYAALTTTRVATRAGVSVGTLYQYFPDKRSLVTALKVQYFELIVGRIAEAARASSGLPLEPAIRAMVRTLLAVKREHHDLTMALREPMLEAGGDAIVREATGRLVAEVRHVLEGAAPDLADAETAAATLVAAIEGVVGTVVYTAPQRLKEPGLEEELVSLAVGYIEARRTRVG